MIRVPGMGDPENADQPAGEVRFRQRWRVLAQRYAAEHGTDVVDVEAAIGVIRQQNPSLGIREVEQLLRRST